MMDHQSCVSEKILFKELKKAGKIKLVIDRCYPLEKTAEANRHGDKGQKKEMSSFRWNIGNIFAITIKTRWRAWIL